MPLRPSARARARVTMLLENNAYPADVRVRREAESLRDGGWDVHVIAPRAAGQPRREVVDGVRVERFRLPREREGVAALLGEYLVANVQLHARALRALARGAHVLHLHNPPDTLFPAAWAARALRRAVVFDLHDLAPELFAEKFGSAAASVAGLAQPAAAGRAARASLAERLVVRTLRGCERRTARAASAVLTTNASYRDVVAERDGVPVERIAIVRNGPLAATIVAQPSLREGALSDPHLLFLGSMESQDGVDELPRLLAALRGRHGLTGATLTCVGEGGRRAAVQAACVAAGLDGAATFTGQVPHADVPALLGAADICLDPAPPGPLNDRSTMIKIAEYLAAGRPVVANPLHETRHTAGNAAAYAARLGADGLADAVAALAADPARRRALAAAGLARARELTWEHSAAELLRAYAPLAPAGAVAPAPASPAIVAAAPAPAPAPAPTAPPGPLAPVAPAAAPLP
jgi:glycosyltransferase involved in cell wall biosynthesis